MLIDVAPGVTHRVVWWSATLVGLVAWPHVLLQADLQGVLSSVVNIDWASNLMFPELTVGDARLLQKVLAYFLFQLAAIIPALVVLRSWRQLASLRRALPQASASFAVAAIFNGLIWVAVGGLGAPVEVDVSGWVIGIGVVSATVGTAVVEEVHYRGAMWVVAGNLMGPKARFVLVSLAFVVLHPAESWLAVTVASIVFGGLRVYFRSVAVPIGAHAGWNVVHYLGEWGFFD